MNAIGNMHEVRFSKISILSHIVCDIPPLTIIIALAIKAVGFSKVRQTFSNIFAMHYGDVLWLCIMVYFRLKSLLLLLHD